MEKCARYLKSAPVIFVQRRTWRRWLVSVSEAEAEDNSVSCVTCVSCQQAASGAPKCTICDQVCHAIIPCTSATDDEDGRAGAHDFCFLAARQEPTGSSVICFPLLTQRSLISTEITRSETDSASRQNTLSSLDMLKSNCCYWSSLQLFLRHHQCF